MPKTNVFVIMPFEDEFFEVYELLKERFGNEFEFTHAGDDVSTQQNILKDIIQMIYEADVVIADLTGLNANVFYELGIAHTLGKKVIAITQDINQLPFDIRSYRATEYSTHFKKFDHLVKELNRYLEGAIDDSIKFSNPVSDFLITVDKGELVGVLTESKSHSIVLGDEKGFVDYLADIDDEMNYITVALNEFVDNMNEMSAGITSCTNEINRVGNGGSGTASFVRKQAQKTAKYIDKFSVSVRSHNSIFIERWPRVENDCLSLLENKYVHASENKKGLVKFLKSLYFMQESSLSTKGQLESFVTSFIALQGVERSLNQAIKSLEIDMKNFIDFIEQMCASVSRILEKSKFVVGDIDYSVSTDTIDIEV